MKTRLQALSLLDRAFSAMTDDELTAAVDALPDDHREALAKTAGTDVVGLRAAAARGRLNGDLETISTLLADACLAQCIELLGDHADNPTEEQLLAAVPTLVEQHGLAVVRLMLAMSVAGEAAASPTLVRLLKHHDTLALPKVEADDTVVLARPPVDEATRARRKALKEQKQAAARARREQQARARQRG